MKLWVYIGIAAMAILGAYLAMFSDLLVSDSNIAEAGRTTEVALVSSVQGATVELIGHHDLLSRGMNSALAVAGNYVYVGSRTEGETHPNGGVLIIDVSDPSNPELVGQIGPPYEALYGISSRELRAVPDKNLLIVLNFSCSTRIHDCNRDENRFPNTGGVAEKDNFKFYDISNPAQPRLISTYEFPTFPGSGFSAKPHEFFLWRDPVNTDRILAFVATPGGPPSLQVLDLSDVENVEIIAEWDGRADAGLTETPGDDGAYLHSLAVSDDGTFGYMAYEGAGYFAIDTSEISAGVVNPQIRLVGEIDNRVDYTPPHPAGNHTAAKVPNRPLIITTDEIYPKPLLQGCPWGWMRLIDISDPENPFIASEYKLPQNEIEQCAPDRGPEGVAYTSHNPTITENMVIVTWHAGGLQFVDISDETN